MLPLVASLLLVPTQSAQSLKWAETAYQETLDIFAADWAPQLKYKDAAERYLRLREVGASDAVTSPKLAKLFLAMGQLEKAEQECDKWEKATNVPAAKQLSQRVRSLQVDRAYLKRLLPAKREVLHVGRVQGVLVAVTILREEDGYGVSKARLHTLSPDGLKEFKLGNRWLEGDDDANELTMLARDMDGDGKDELLVENVLYGASWTPSVMHVFRVGKDDRLSHIGSQPGHDPLAVRKDNRGRWCIRSVDAIGADLSHAEQPRWPTYTRVSGNALVEAGPGFPVDYRESLKEINDCLTRHPKDYDLLGHKAETLAFLGEADKARKCYGLAAKHLETYIQSPENKAWFNDPDGKKYKASLIKSLAVLKAKAVGKGLSHPLPNPRG